MGARGDDLDRYVVFDLSSPRSRDVVMAETWTQARMLGARKLRIREERVWAVAPYDGETNEDAWKREVKRKGGG